MTPPPPVPPRDSDEPIVEPARRHTACRHPLHALAWQTQPPKPAVIRCRQCGTEFTLQPPRRARRP